MTSVQQVVYSDSVSILYKDEICATWIRFPYWSHTKRKSSANLGRFENNLVDFVLVETLHARLVIIEGHSGEDGVLSFAATGLHLQHSSLSYSPKENSKEKYKI